MKKIRGTFFISLFMVALFMGIESQAVNVTFRVDMQDQIVSPEGVHIAGSFPEPYPLWNPAGILLSPPPLGSVYSVTLSLAEGTYIEFKYINGDEWGEDESVPGSCAQNNNRYYTVPANDTELPLVCFGSCLPCVLPLVDITLQVDMSNETISPEGVFIAGSFQDPQWTNQAMTHIGNDVYSITVQMGVGSFQEYKFKNGTGGWETVPPQCAWNNNNRYLDVPTQNTTLPLVCFGSCDPCSTVTYVDVTFQVDMSEQTVAPEGVHIAGGFQGWNPSGTLMTDLGNGIWSYTATLQSGTFQQYKFVNGDEWAEAEQNIPWYCNNGGDRYITVPVNNTVLPAVCFGSCLVCNPTPRDITFRVDMSLQQVSPLGVHLAGSFQGWVPGGTPMTDVGNNIYEVTLAIGEGEFHEYKFINGDDWPGAETVPGDCAGLGGNREFFIPSSNTVLDLVCFGECGPCITPIHTFDLTVMLEGPYNGTDMNSKLDENNVLAEYQPYDDEPWQYYGNENILFGGPPSGIVDWVLVEFRSTDGDASTATADKRFHMKAALLMEDGSVTKTDGTSPLEYTGPIFNNLYVVIWHRNHLPIMSATALSPADGNYVYDFTTVQSYLDGQKQINTGVFGMIAGDSDANGTVNNLDKIEWNNKAGDSGYLNSDNDLDGQSDNVDKNDIWIENQDLQSVIPD
jgi:hypothetical protein